jgi:hypothetical protein
MLRVILSREAEPGKLPDAGGGAVSDIAVVPADPEVEIRDELER